MHRRAYITKRKEKYETKHYDEVITDDGKSLTELFLPDDDFEKYLRLDRELGESRGSSAGRNDYMNGLAVAKKDGCLMRSVLRPSDLGVSRIPPKPMGAPEKDGLILLRIVAESLGRTPARSTLKETLQLARSRPAENLREVLGGWVEAISSGDTDILKRMPQEIEQAQKGLRRAGQVGGVGTFVTWISVPTAAAEIVLGSPGLVGGSLALLGAAADVERRRREERHGWAMFGTI